MKKLQSIQGLNPHWLQLNYLCSETNLVSHWSVPCCKASGFVPLHFCRFTKYEITYYEYLIVLYRFYIQNQFISLGWTKFVRILYFFLTNRWCFNIRLISITTFHTGESFFTHNNAALHAPQSCPVCRFVSRSASFQKPFQQVFIYLLPVFFI